MFTALGLEGVRLVSFDIAGELSTQAGAFLVLLGASLLRRDSLPNMLVAHNGSGRSALTYA